MKLNLNEEKRLILKWRKEKKERKLNREKLRSRLEELDALDGGTRKVNRFGIIISLLVVVCMVLFLTSLIPQKPLSIEYIVLPTETIIKEPPAPTTVDINGSNCTSKYIDAGSFLVECT